MFYLGAGETVDIAFPVEVNRCVSTSRTYLPLQFLFHFQLYGALVPPLQADASLFCLSILISTAQTCVGHYLAGQLHVPLPQPGARGQRHDARFPGTGLIEKPDTLNPKPGYREQA